MTREQQPTLQVQLTKPSVLAVGPYRAGEMYEVPADEAARLVELKGFVYADTDTPNKQDTPQQED